MQAAMPSIEEQKQLLRKVAEWLAIDVNEKTRSQIEQLASNMERNYDKLDDLLTNRIVFGTAGLRARMEAGFSRMNDVTVLQASQGLAEYILGVTERTKEASIVVGHDHRHNSKRFAELTIAVFLLKGFKVYYVGPDDCATPMVPFAIDHLGTLGGIMVTASHNPKDDNGYKVYWSNGCQIIPPHDSNIQRKILQNLEPILNHDDKWDTVHVFETYKEKLEYSYNQIVSAYTSHLLTVLQPAPISDFKIVYTAMHGVGHKFVSNLIKSFVPEMGNFVSVKEQCAPDPDFPTVSFPNPEEKNALDLSISTADALGEGFNLIVANDPDADRFTAAFRQKNGSWKQLSGNEIGVLFVDYVIHSQFLDKSVDVSNVYMLNSTVSSQMIGSIATKLGFNFKDTLTGFKWIGNKAIELEKKGYTVPFAYEEAIGFMFPTVHDKDGISALLVFLQLYDRLLKQGLDPEDKLEQLYKIYGNFKQCNGYYVTSDQKTLPSIFNNIIRVKNVPEGESSPTKIGNYSVKYWQDLTVGYDSSTPDHKPELYVDPASQMITCTVVPATSAVGTDEFIRFTARGSGTEPKLKVYIEARSPTASRAEYLASDVWDTLRNEWFQPEKHSLVERKV